MKTNLIITLILFLIMVFFPIITLIDREEKNLTDSSAGTTVSDVKNAETTQHKEKVSEKVSLIVSATGKTTEMSVEEYVYGAVCAEMPASFHIEALKAQAVASYTYMKWLKENADNPSSVITDNSAVHQAFVTDSELKEKWGSSYEIYSQKVKEAVGSVLYEYLVFEGETAMTVFHGLSPGKTADSEEIWKSALPYLQSVTAPGDRLSPEITTKTEFSKEEFVKIFDDAKAEDYDGIIKGINKNEDGFINSITFKEKTLLPSDIRSALNLNSPFIKADKSEKGISLTVYGKGHGVGMSQYSADYMARQGSTYKEILAHFYKGTELVSG